MVPEGGTRIASLAAHACGAEKLVMLKFVKLWNRGVLEVWEVWEGA